MEPLLIILIPGVLGGFVLALLIARMPRRQSSLVAKPLAPPSPAIINMAHIPIEGIGGLGMVAAVIVVAVSDPRIRLVILLAFVLGAGLAAALIALRRRTGALPSGGDGPDHGSMLGLDVEQRHAHAGKNAVAKRPLSSLAFG